MKKEGDLEIKLKQGILIVSLSIFFLLFFPVISTLAKQDASETFNQYSDYQNPSINDRFTGNIILNASQDKEPRLGAMLTVSFIAVGLIIALGIFIRKKHKDLQSYYYH